MDDGAMDDALEAGRGLRLVVASHDQGAKLVVEIVDDALPEPWIGVAGAQQLGSISIVEECEQEMLERHVLVLPRVGSLHRSMKRSLEALRERGHACQPRRLLELAVRWVLRAARASRMPTRTRRPASASASSSG